MSISNIDVVGKTAYQVLNDLSKLKQTTAIFDIIHEGHEPNTCYIFTVKALGKFAIGKGRYKKQAKQQACLNLIRKLRIFNDEELSHISEVSNRVIPLAEQQIDDSPASASCQLAVYCSSKQLPAPQYETVRGGLFAPEPNVFVVKCAVSTVQFGECRTFKSAKEIAAANMLQQLKSMDRSDEVIHQSHDIVHLPNHGRFHKTSFTLTKLINNQIKILNNNAVLMLLTIAKELDVPVDLRELFEEYDSKKPKVYIYKILTEPELTGAGFTKFNAAKNLLDAMVVTGAYL